MVTDRAFPPSVVKVTLFLVPTYTTKWGFLTGSVSNTRYGYFCLTLSING